jgi:redox-sensing transcriptional repressor
VAENFTVDPHRTGDMTGMNSGKRKRNTLASQDVPKAVVSRLSLYLREFEQLERSGKRTVSSSQLGRRLGFSDAQVRKDLARFGHFGHPGIGYRCEELVAAVRHILGTDRDWTVALVGVGNLGRALLGYKGFATKGFRIVAAFDCDTRKSGGTIGGIPVYQLERLADVAKRQRIQLAILAVPVTAAQQVAEQVAEAGIAGILNFAAVTLNLPNSVTLIGVDLATELEQISFSVANR